MNYMEYFFDTDPGWGNGHEVSIVSDSVISADININIASLSDGFHNLYVRAKGSNSQWSTPFYRSFYKSRITSEVSTSQVVKAEYFFDADPGLKSGVNIPITSDSLLVKEFAVDLQNVSIGFHNLYIRVQNAEGKWSTLFFKPFYKSRIVSDTQTSNIVRAEYFLDTDPGYNSGTNIPVMSDSLISKSFIVDLNSSSIGFHNLYVRVQNAEGKWSTSFFKPFYKSRIANETSTSSIVKAEYFLDTDPGLGQGHDISIAPDSVIVKTFTVDLGNLSIGFHNLYIRTKNAEGKWSTAFYKPFYKFGGIDNTAEKITGVEYYFDADLGVGFGHNIFPNPDTLITKDFSADISALGSGSHKFFTRVRNSDNKWSYTDSVQFTMPDTISFLINLTSGWNLLSVPLKAYNMQAISLFPDANSLPYRYANNTYLVSDTLQNGVGYWIKYPNSQAINSYGNYAAATTIPVMKGWNMIGPYDKTIPVASMTTTPPGIINSAIFRYTYGYLAADTMQVGKGYWIRVTENGVLHLPVGIEKANSNPVLAAQHRDDWGKIVVSDAAGNSRTMYLKKGNADLASYDMPPLPPSTVFDVRFGTHRDVENINKQGGQDILVQGVVYPLTVRVENVNLLLTDNISGQFISAKLKTGQQYSISNEAISRLHIQGEVIPLKFALEQNYPNPFNPSTTIRYQIPEAGKVTIKIFDALGKELTTLVNENKESGSYSVEFNAAGYASGVYICELKCNAFSAIKKLSLLK